MSSVGGCEPKETVFKFYRKVSDSEFKSLRSIAQRQIRILLQHALKAHDPSFKKYYLGQIKKLLEYEKEIHFE